MANTWKAPQDKFDYLLDFSPLLAPYEVIDAIVGVTAERMPGGTDSTAEIIDGDHAPSKDDSGLAVLIWLKGGILHETHRITVRVTTNGNRQYDGFVNLDILNL
jgi:hypothetical protein